MMSESRFSISRFGFNERETQLLLTSFIGLAVIHKSVTPTTNWLTQHIYSCGVESQIDLEEVGMDLGTFDSSPEVPLEYQDLAEKIQKLADWESAALYFYVCGFFEGQAWVTNSSSFGKPSA